MLTLSGVARCDADRRRRQQENRRGDPTRSVVQVETQDARGLAQLHVLTVPDHSLHGADRRAHELSCACLGTWGRLRQPDVRPALTWPDLWRGAAAQHPDHGNASADRREGAGPEGPQT